MSTPPTALDAPTPTADRALAPDLARGGMLLLIALANVHIFLWGHPIGVRGYPDELAGADQLVALAQMTLVDGRAYPLFALLFGYGIGQLTRRRTNAGDDVGSVRALVRRRGRAMMLLGLVHAALLWSGDIVGVYGLVAIVLAGTLVAARDAVLLRVAAIGLGLATLFSMGSGLPLPGEARSFLPSMTIADPLVALVFRLGEWTVVGLLFMGISTFGAVALGVWASRRRLLDEPVRHATLLRRLAVGGIGAGVVAGLPLGLAAAGFWSAPPIGALLAAGALHTAGGYAAGIGYAAAFGLLAVRLTDRRTGVVTGAVLASGRRSLSSYLAQSLVFAPLLPAWALGLGASFTLWQGALLAVATWAVVLVLAAVVERQGWRGPAEVVLRRATYRPRPGAVSPASHPDPPA